MEIREEREREYEDKAASRDVVYKLIRDVFAPTFLYVLLMLSKGTQQGRSSSVRSRGGLIGLMYLKAEAEAGGPGPRAREEAVWRRRKSKELSNTA